MTIWRKIISIIVATIAAWPILNSPLQAQTVPAANVIYTPPGTGGVAQTAQKKFQQAIYADDYGADPTCTTDSAPAIAAAFAATGAGPVYLHGCYRASSTVYVPSGRALIGDNFEADNPVNTASTRIVCDLTVTPCVQVGNGGAYSTSLRQVVVTRAAGTPSASAVGVRVYEGNNITIVDVNSVSHGICYQLTSHPSVGWGLGFMATRIYSGACSAVHMDIDSWPEVRVSQARFGMNGTGDYAGTSYLRIRGGVAGTAGGPNTIVFENSQFNQGSLKPTYFADFINLASGGTPSVDATEFYFTNVHVEGVGTAVFHSDSSWNTISNLYITGSTFNDTGIPAFSLNSATRPFNWYIVNSSFFNSNFNIAPTGGFTNFNITGGYLLGTMSLTGTSGSTGTITGLAHGGNQTIAGLWGSFSSIGEYFNAGAQTITATGGISVIQPQYHFVQGGTGVPTVSACGTSPVLDGRSRDTGGVVVVGTGTVTSCTVTYSRPFPNVAFPTITGAGSVATGGWVSGFTNTGFTVSFPTNVAGSGFFYTVAGF